MKIADLQVHNELACLLFSQYVSVGPFCCLSGWGSPVQIQYDYFGGLSLKRLRAKRTKDATSPTKCKGKATIVLVFFSRCCCYD